MYDKLRKGIIAGVILMLILLGVLLGIKSCSFGNTDDKEPGSIEVEEEFSENAEKEDVEEDADSKENVENVLDETDTKEEKAEKTDKNKKKENTPAKENQHSAVNQNHGNGANAGNNANSEKKDDAGNTGSSGNTGNEGNTGSSGNTGNEGSTGSSGNTGNEGSSGNGGTTQEPSDSENIPDENGYYVVWDDFNFGKINNWTDTVFSSWDITLPTTTPAKGTDGAVFADGSNYAKGQARRAFNAITEDFTLELTMRADYNMDHTFLDLRGAGTTAIRLEVKGDSLYFEDTKLCQLPTEDLTALKLHISPSKGKFTISVDGATVKTGTEAKEFSLLSACTSLDELYIETGKEDVGSVVIGTVRIYTGYYINEKFLDGKNEIINDEWKTTGEVKTVFKQGTQGPDNYSAVMTSGTALERAVSYVQKGAWLEYQLLMEENAQAAAMELSDDAGNTFKVAVEEGNFGYYEGNRFKKLYECKENLWYHIMLKQTDEGTELYLNHKLKAEKIDLPFEKFTHIRFRVEGGTAYLDDVIVKDWIPLPEDYVPEPVAVQKDEDAKLVGMQSCSLWTEGEHFGYDWLTDWPEREPVLGYYDEMRSEATDWELKFKIEHGIDFEMYCWYRPMSGEDEPIKMARNSRALHEGYMNAEYSDKMKFAITWETGGGVSGMEDFKENVIPYWIEQYFKDERYLLIDNKPLIGMYNINRLMSFFNGTDGVREALTALREACQEAGFDGAYVIMCNSALGYVNSIAQAGFDGQYAYTWGGDDISSQYKGMTNIQKALNEAGYGKNGVVPVATQGYYDKAWDRNDGKYYSVESFQEVLTWIRDEFMPSLDQESLGSKMVLLDNWNEYSEGHFIMPAKLAGFGYLDAVRGVFGDGNGVSGSHTAQDIIPTDEQLSRIQHMYVQDRHVVLVEKEPENISMEVLGEYEWNFNTDYDYEGWTIGVDDGRWIKRLERHEVKNGVLYGKTVSPDTLGQTSSGPETADPSLMSPDNLNIDASEVVAFKVRMKGVGGQAEIGQPQLYWITATDQSWNGLKMQYGKCVEGTDGYTEVTFDLTNAIKTGTIKQFRLDPIERDGEFWIDSIQIMRMKDNGDAEVYLDGKKIYTSSPLKVQDGVFMFPVEELSSIISVYPTESFENDTLYLAGINDFYEFPYTGETKLLVNGVAKESVGAAKIDGKIYVPLEDIIKNASPVIDAKGNSHPAYEFIVTPATETARARIDINKFVDEAVLKGFYFDFSLDDWTYGGGNVVTTPALDGKGNVTAVANGENAKLWSSEGTLFNVDPAKADHVRLRVKTSVDGDANLKVVLYGNGVTYSHTYEVTLKKAEQDQNGFSDVSLDLSEAKSGGLRQASKIDRVCIFWYTNAAGGLQTITLDSFEILDLEETTEPTPPPVTPPTTTEPTGDDKDKWTEANTDYSALIKGWYFETGEDNWERGGSTVKSAQNGTLKVTGGDPEGARVWSSNSTSGLNVETSAADTVRVRIYTKVTNPKIRLGVTYNKIGASTLEQDFTENVDYVPGEDGWTIVTFNLKDMPHHTEEYTIGRIGFYPLGQQTTEAASQTAYIDYAEILKRAEPEPPAPTEPTGDDKDKWTEANTDYSALIKGWYFEAGEDNWGRGGSTVKSAQNGTLKVTGGDQEGARVWSSDSTSGLAVETSAADTVRVRIYTKVTNPKIRLGVTYNKIGASTLEQDFTENVDYVPGEDGWTIVTFNLKDMPHHTEEYTIGRIGFYPLGQRTTEAASQTAYIDYAEILKRAETEPTVIKSWTFDTGNDGWTIGGAELSYSSSEGAIVFTPIAQSGTGAGWKSPDNLAIDPAKVTSICATIKVPTGKTPKKAEVICYSDNGSTSKGSVVADYVCQEGNIYTVTFDVTSLNPGFTDGEKLNKIRINPMNIAEDSYKFQYFLDKVEIYAQQ